MIAVGDCRLNILNGTERFFTTDFENIEKKILIRYNPEFNTLLRKKARNPLKIQGIPGFSIFHEIRTKIFYLCFECRMIPCMAFFRVIS